MSEISIITPNENDYHDLSIMVGELLNEIMQTIGDKVFNYNQVETEKRAKNLIENNKYWVFLARNNESEKNIGFVSLYESYALYSEGEYGTIPELYVRPKYRSKSVGIMLLNKASEFAVIKGWGRLEVTTPPLPEFDKTLKFYQKNGFSIAGGRKLKIDVKAL
ncbi:MAG: GNAT family N-acetyltransferase [Methylococcaceae bacterium]